MKSETTQARVSGTLDPIVRQSSFGDWYDIGTNADVVILATNDGGGLVPRQLCLPHQVYVRKVRELEETHHATVTAIPAMAGDYVHLPNAPAEARCKASPPAGCSTGGQHGND